MKKISNLIFLLIFIMSFSGCIKRCDESLRMGEMVEIPIQFIDFKVSDIDNILVCRIDHSNQNSIDTFFIRDILWANTARTTNEIITDRENKPQVQFGQYESYFDKCSLIFNWDSGRDTLANFEIKKSQEKINGCHKNDPNVKIDKFSFIHKGKTISKNETIKITK